MPIAKIARTVLTCALFSSIVLAIFAYLIDDQLFPSSGSWIGPPKEPWELKVITVALYGAGIGTSIGLIASVVERKLPLAVASGLLLSSGCGWLLRDYMGASWSYGLTKVWIASIVVSLLTGGLASFVNSSAKSLA
jgi:hypothetical protein